MNIQAAIPKSTAVFNVDESPLSRLHHRKLITEEQFFAGEKLRQDFERSHLTQRVTMSYAEGGISSSRYFQISDNAITNLNDNAIAARQCLHHAMQAVGPELGAILQQVCCLTAGLEQAERILALPARSGKVVLGLALTRLARHYGIGTRRAA